MKEINIEALATEFGFSDEDDDNIRRIKEALESLSETDKRIMWLYADQGSMRKVALALRVSPATVFKYIHKIREKIYVKLADNS